MPVILLLLIMWLGEGLDAFLQMRGGGFDQMGIIPGRSDGLLGILYAPVFHFGWQHLLTNTVPFVVLGFLTLFSEKKHFWGLTIGITLVGGLATWAFGEPGTVHQGASGLIFGYLGFLIAKAITTRHPMSLLIAILVGALYGGLILSLLRIEEGVSWSGHVGGFVAGIIGAIGYPKDNKA